MMFISEFELYNVNGVNVVCICCVYDCSKKKLSYWKDITKLFLFVQVGVFMTVCQTTLVRNYVFMLIKTYQKSDIFLDIFHRHVLYPKTLTKMEFCLERILTFCTLNEHIFLVKCASDDDTIFGEIVFRACASAPDAKNWNLTL